MTPALLTIIYVLLAVVALVAIGVLLARAGRSRQQRADEVRTNDEDTLVVDVPRGQDPAAVVAALQADGIEAMADPADPQKVLVPTAAGTDRERARAIVEGAPTNIDPGAGPAGGRPGFSDENGSSDAGARDDLGGDGTRPAP